MNDALRECVVWAQESADDYAERWDVTADDVVKYDPQLAAHFRAIAKSIRAAAAYARTRAEIH